MRFGNLKSRLGERHNVHGIVLDWNTDGRRQRRPGQRKVESADVIDVSVSGAQLLAKPNKKLTVGSVVTISAAGALGTVRIRRIANAISSDLCTYGVEFMHLEPPLEALIYARFSAEQPTAQQVVWQS